MNTSLEKAQTPEALSRLFVERPNPDDAAGIAALYERDAVIADPPGSRRSAARRSAAYGRRRWRTRRNFGPRNRDRPCNAARSRSPQPSRSTAPARIWSAGSPTAAGSGCSTKPELFPREL